MERPSLTFDLSGRARLTVLDADSRVGRYVSSQMDPYVGSTTGGCEADVILEPARLDEHRFVEVHNPAGDGLVTAADETQLYIVRDGHACSLPEVAPGRAAQFRYQPEFPLWEVFSSAVRPALQIATLAHDAAAVHSASVEVDGAGIVIAGWSESGKTETALAFLEGGGRFVSDKWTVLGADRTIATFPISVGIRRWVLAYLPRLRAALPAAARAQLTAAGIAAAGSAPFRRARPRGRVGRLAVSAMERAIALADRAALTPSQVARAYGHDRPRLVADVRALALLTTVPRDDVRTRERDPGWAARRLARSAAYERRSLLELRQRARFAAHDLDDGPFDLFEKHEEAFLAKALAATQLIEVEAPFPTDPRRVADAIWHAL